MEDVRKLTGYVALIDVLGFRELVGRDDQLRELGRYIESVQTLMEKPGSDLEFVLFSDNLVINTKDNTPASFVHLVAACSHLSHALLEQHIAVRGAIALGSFVRSPATRQGVILAGRPIVEALEYEHLQDWVGIMLAPSAVRDREDTLMENCTTHQPSEGMRKEQWLGQHELALHLQYYPGIPFRADPTLMDDSLKSFAGYAVVPLRPGVGSPFEIRESLENTNKHLERMRFSAPNPVSQKKYASADQFLRTVKSRWQFGVKWDPR